MKFLCVDAVGFKIPDNVDQIFLFQPFSVEIFKSVLAELFIDSYYENQREMLV